MVILITWYVVGVASCISMAYMAYKFDQRSVTVLDVFMIFILGLFGPFMLLTAIDMFAKEYKIDEKISNIIEMTFSKKIIEHPEDVDKS